MATRVLYQIPWSGTPVEQAILFRLTDGDLLAVCRLFNHSAGWELRLEVNGVLAHAWPCASPTEVCEFEDRWKSEMIEDGWR
jgi:hypothetical protein